MKKTILQIAKYYHPVEGGIETVTKYMAEGLTAFNNYVVCFSQDGITRMDTINGIKVYRIAPAIKISSQGHRLQLLLLPEENHLRGAARHHPAPLSQPVSLPHHVEAYAP